MVERAEEQRTGTDGPAIPAEESGYVPSGEGHLYGLLLQTEAAVDEANGVVLLSPLAEERKSSLRALV